MRRAQSSIEFLVITGIGLTLITTAAIAFLSYTRQGGDDARLAQVTDIGNQILAQAEWVNSLGGYSWNTVQTTMPDGVTAIYVAENSTLVFDVQTQHGVISQPVFSTIPITGVNASGTRNYVYVTPLGAHSGRMDFRVTGKGNIVEIQAVS
jgi:hypothetical protein